MKTASRMGRFPVTIKLENEAEQVQHQKGDKFIKG